MKLKLKYFASIRETIGISTEERSTTAQTLGELRDELIGQGDAYALALARGKAVRMSMNQLMCEESAVLSDACEVAFFPPVTGG